MGRAIRRGKAKCSKGPMKKMYKDMESTRSRNED